MPATIVKGSEFSLRGIVLSQSSCVEQVNGLVEVQTRWFVDKARQSEIDRLFFVDAQPPRHPGCITKASLLTQRLYMVSRSVTSENGFLAVDASYVGALARPGSRGFYLTVAKGPTTAGLTLLGIGNVEQVLGYPPAQKAYFFDYFVNEITVEYVQIGGLTAAAIPNFTISDVFSLVKVKTVQSGTPSVARPAVGLYTAEQVLGEDPFVNEIGGVTNFDSPNYRVSASFASTLLRTEEPASFFTPTVKIAKIRFTL
jgi:hypothetical protein